jgi:pyrroline-5-carboxylate reductase
MTASPPVRHQRVAVLGAGKIGEALLSGMIRAGWVPAELLLTARRPERAAELRERYGVEAVSNAEAAKAADTLILAVKPQDMGALIDELAPHVTADRLVISAAAGIPTAFFEERLIEGIPVVRVMPNTPVLVDEGMSVISAGRHAGEAHLARAEAIFQPVGKTLRVPEKQQDAATALSGSGPAYFYYLVEAMTDAGILLGLPRAQAHDLIVQSAIGAAVMLRDSGEHPVKLREAVTSPAGTTINAIRELENHGVRAALLAALEAARDRSRELASGA